MTVVKILIMGLPAAGKTTFIRRVFEQTDFKQLEDYRPTFGVGVSLYEFKSSKGVMVSTFDCGGQTSFIESHMKEGWAPILFGGVSIMLFFVDSAAKENLGSAVSLLHKYHEHLKANSSRATVHILASKWDKHTLSLAELDEAFRGMMVYPVSALDETASYVAQAIIDEFLTDSQRPS
jgi:GTPase SAR1 family protein